MTRPSGRGHDISALFPMISGGDAEAWARHAHPVSVWTRVLFGLPLLILAGWSRVWIGPWWTAALAAAVFFIWINPLMTPVPRSTDNWRSKSTIGERLWLRMNRDEVPRRHRTVPRVLMIGSALGHGWVCSSHPATGRNEPTGLVRIAFAARSPSCFVRSLCGGKEHDLRAIPRWPPADRRVIGSLGHAPVDESADSPDIAALYGVPAQFIHPVEPRRVIRDDTVSFPFQSRSGPGKESDT
ncbi:DUF6653 family protein [Meridianimarinicoccus sp. RP-17]|nr:DUF6653 family protein [Phycocomes zhengii]